MIAVRSWHASIKPLLVGRRKHSFIQLHIRERGASVILATVLLVVLGAIVLLDAVRRPTDADDGSKAEIIDGSDDRQMRRHIPGWNSSTPGANQSVATKKF